MKKSADKNCLIVDVSTLLLVNIRQCTLFGHPSLMHNFQIWRTWKRWTRCILLLWKRKLTFRFLKKRSVQITCIIEYLQKIPMCPTFNKKWECWTENLISPDHYYKNQQRLWVSPGILLNLNLISSFFFIKILFIGSITHIAYWEFGLFQLFRTLIFNRNVFFSW